MLDAMELPVRDSTPLDTDWTDFGTLLADMRKFASENPGWTWKCADDPGMNHVPPRIGRMGWVAYKEPEDPYRDTERMKSWTITLSNMKKSWDAHRDDPVYSPVWRAITTAAGRQAMLDEMVSASV